MNRGLTSPKPWLLLAGGVHALSLAWPGQGQAWGSLQWLSMLALALSLWPLVQPGLPGRQAGREAAWRAGCFALGALAGAFWWLHVSMHQVGGMPAWLSVTAVLALAGALALYTALAAALWVWGVRAAQWQQRPRWASLWFAAVWLGAELLRGTWWTGFPWGASGYAHVDSALAPLAPWVGVYGMGALSAGAAMRLAIPRARARVALGGLLALALVQALPDNARLTRAVGDAVQVELLQANIAQTEKFDPGQGVREALGWYGERLLGSTAALVVAPETALPLLPEQLPPRYWAQLQARFASTGGEGSQLALVGVPWREPAQGYRNAVLALGPEPVGGWRYDKHHLVPFGEFIPPGFAWLVRTMQIPLGEFEPGPLGPAPLLWAGQRLALNICYEDLFGEELARPFARADLAPTVLINVSNIAWFGDTVAVDQHLNISRMRALELGRPMLRATNTGATAIIDHRGQVQAQLPRFTRGGLQGQVQGREGLTPYAQWASRWGLWPLWACVLAAGALVAWAAWRRTRA